MRTRQRLCRRAPLCAVWKPLGASGKPRRGAAKTNKTKNDQRARVLFSELGGGLWYAGVSRVFVTSKAGFSRRQLDTGASLLSSGFKCRRLITANGIQLKETMMRLMTGKHIAKVILRLLCYLFVC
jgi:hypothetical protein